jgi:hypothetical protein
MFGLVDSSGNAIVDANGSWIVIGTAIPGVPVQLARINLSGRFQADVEPFIDHDILWRRR